VETVLTAALVLTQFFQASHQQAVVAVVLLLLLLELAAVLAVAVEYQAQQLQLMAARELLDKATQAGKVVV
jgi:hypothetical protein